MNQQRAFTAADLPPLPWLEVVDPSVCLGRVRHAVFDFDGTISVIRRGWEATLISLMVETICGHHSAAPKIEAEVAEYVDHSTGVPTIEQMAWLVEAVDRYGLAQANRTAREYKRIYSERLSHTVRQRMGRLNDESNREAFTIAGVRDFLQGLHQRGVGLRLVSGTDHGHVLEEAGVLGVAEFFGEHIYGARDDTPTHTKEQVIQRTLDDHDLHSEELLVVGDGPEEIRHAAAKGAVVLGVAADEERRRGLDPRKRERLLDAGAGLIVTDFSHHDELVRYLVADGAG